MQLAPHLHRLGNDIVATYLIDTPEGITLIDAGFPGHWRDLHKEVTALGKRLSDIKGLILTHGDCDHIGFAERLRDQHGVPVYVHAADADQARTGARPKATTGPMRLGPTMGFFAYALRKDGLRARHVQQVDQIADGDVLPLPGKPKVIGLPGHSPGSIAIHVPIADAVMIGDAFVTRHLLTGRRGPQPAPFSQDPQAALSSLERLTELQASWVLPAHGAPWHGSPADAVAAAQLTR
ncbi:MBL fold metallo-hydrolase [Streptomyces bathyalis]|uniref:MBL fold metallo-hydrolase n=1 Tax=Streptomyces bathyalis TaxID=2710756 RepID=A0A7T1WQP3_9ACTN|nr:MBL fold metallo-hydrolase [Streptomyces bathyalis]QPP05142.1 MBL fold metallo-hydrolase [Streptomyces bathyalis]